MGDFPGTRKRVTLTCRNELTSALTDPTALAVTYRNINGAPTTKTWPTDSEVVHDSTGVFHIDVDCPSNGTWYLRAAATGALVAASETSWQIEPSAF